MRHELEPERVPPRSEQLGIGPQQLRRAGDRAALANRLLPRLVRRLVVGDGYGKIGRMAVLRDRRGEGLGALVLQALEREGAARGLREFRLSAQLSARGFYDRAGYVADGDIYDEVGIPHIAMIKRV